jgi:tartrate-resistant acid phosphatase type 5
VIGDYGEAGIQEKEVSELVYSWNLDFIITVGDNNYPSGAASTIDQNIGYYYHGFIYPYKGIYGPGASINRFFPSLGNHDWMSENAQPYLNYFTLPGNERFYNFVWGPVEFFAIDSDYHDPSGITATSPQAKWLQQGLASSTATWKIVYFHLPPYSSGAVHGSTSELQWPFQQWGASAVLSGHEHDYERIIVNGFPYFVDGLGGGGIYHFNQNPVPGSQVRYDGNVGAMLVTATGISIEFQFINVKNQVIDTYTINK